MVSSLQKSFTVGLLMCIITAISAFMIVSPHAHAAPTVSIGEQTALISKLLEQIQQLQKLLAVMQGGKSTSVFEDNGTCLNLKNELGYQSRDIYTNGEVSALQDFLQAKGYLSTAPVGFYGLMTTEAVKSFQSQYGIKVTGYVGEFTRAKIKEITCMIDNTRDDEDHTPMVSQERPVIESSYGDQEGGNYILTMHGKRLDTITAVMYEAKMMINLSKATIRSKRSDKIVVALPLSSSYPADFKGDVNIIIKDTLGVAKIWSTYIIYSHGEDDVEKIEAPEITSVDVDMDDHKIKVFGRNMAHVKKLEYNTSDYYDKNFGTLSEGSLGKDSYAMFYFDKFLGMTYGDGMALKVRVVDTIGNKSEWYEVSMRNTYEVTSANLETTFNQDGYSSHSRFDFLVENRGTDNMTVVMDVEPTIDCEDALPGGVQRNCAQYLFDFSQKAGEAYHGVTANPYVKGGAGYRFSGIGTTISDSIYIHAYPNPDYIPGDMETVPYPDSVNYKFILRDTQAGGRGVWSQTYTVVQKG